MYRAETRRFEEVGNDAVSSLSLPEIGPDFSRAAGLRFTVGFNRNRGQFLVFQTIRSGSGAASGCTPGCSGCTSGGHWGTSRGTRRTSGGTDDGASRHPCGSSRLDPCASRHPCGSPRRGARNGASQQVCARS